MSADSTLPARIEPTGRATEIDRIDQVAAGDYWRTKDGVPEREDTYERVNGRWDKQPGGVSTATMTSRREIAVDTVLLVAALNHVDGELHSIDLAAHPLDKNQDKLRFLVDEFYANFEPAPDAKLVRERELASVGQTIADAQASLIAGPPQLGALPAPAAAVPDINALIVHRDRADDIEERARRQLEEAKTRSTWIEARSKDIAGAVALQARFYNEQAVAATASVQTQIRQVESIQKGLRTLELFTGGEDVSVFPLLDGDGAPADEPLTIYQRRLYLDEELAVHLLKGGLKHDDIKDLPRLMARTPGFLARILPAPRSVVLMTLRRYSRSFGPVNSFRDALQAIEDDRLDKQAFLMVRNGAQLSLVWSEHLWSFDGRRDDMDSNGLVRLFPSQGDVDKPFRGVDGRKITPESLDYSDARGRLDDRALAYKRMLVMLWGLQERKAIFGEFYDRGRFESWLDPDFQFERFRFVSDDELALPDARQALSAWIVEKNSYIQSGSRVACDWGQVITETSASGCYSSKENRHGDRYQEYRPTRASGISLARAKGDRFVVTAEVAEEYGKGGKEPRRKNVHVELDEKSKGLGSGWLCLDAVSLEEVDRYIESRRDRVDYLVYLPMFMHVREALSAERVSEAPVEAAMVKAIVDARIGVDADGALRPVREAIRLWRASNRGESFPTNQPAAMRQALDICWTMLGKDVGLDKIVALAADGRDPLRLSIDGAGALIVYAAPDQSERQDVLGSNYWARRVMIDRSGAKPRVTNVSFTPMRARVGSESEIRAWPASAAFVGRKAPGGLSYDDLKDIMAECEAGAGVLRSWSEGVADLAFFHQALERIRKDSPKGYIHRLNVRTPLAIVKRRDRTGVLVAAAQPFEIYARGSKEGLAHALAWIDSRYKESAKPLHELRTAIERPLKPQLQWIPLSVWRVNKELVGDIYTDNVWYGNESLPVEWREDLRLFAEFGERKSFMSNKPLEAKKSFEELAPFMPDGTADLLDEMALVSAPEAEADEVAPAPAP